MVVSKSVFKAVVFKGVVFNAFVLNYFRIDFATLYPGILIITVYIVQFSKQMLKIYSQMMNFVVMEMALWININFESNMKLINSTIFNRNEFKPKKVRPWLATFIFYSVAIQMPVGQQYWIRAAVRFRDRGAATNIHGN